MALILTTIPGFTDLSDTVLVANQGALGLHVEAISSNAAFGMLRCEVFQALYYNGDTVTLPTSPHDNYPYTREECIYFYNPSATTNKDTGWIQIGAGPLWFTNWFVDQATGKVTSSEWYRTGGSGGHKIETADGQLLVYTVAQRQKTSIVMGAVPTYSSISVGDIATDKPWKQSLTQGLNDNAKFSISNHEVFYCGEYVDGQVVPLSSVISPCDGYAYAYAECKFLAFWRWTTTGAAYVQPVESDAFLGPFSWDVDSTGHVTLYQERIDSGGGDHVAAGYGRVGVFAFCTRSATPGSAPLAASFSEIDEAIFTPGSSLRASTVLKIKQNIDEAVLNPEFFGVTEYKNGDVIALPVSPVDGYTYTRDELCYIWSWNMVRPETGSHVRIPLFYGGIDQASGVVTLACWRLTDHYVDDNNTLCRIKVLVMARRERSAPADVTGNPVNPPGDVGTIPADPIINPYAIAYDMGGGRLTLPASGESLLAHVISANLVSVTLPVGLVGSAAGIRTPATVSYQVNIHWNGGLVGTINYGAGSTSGTFSFGAIVVLHPGDTLEFIGGAQDATALGVYWTIVGSRA